MNQLDIKILETCGWTYSHETNVWFNRMGGWSHEDDPELITTDMLIEAAGKQGEWCAEWNSTSENTFVVSIEADDWYSGKTLASAIRAALAAHWGVSDE